MATASSYPVLSSHLDLRGQQFQSNQEAWVPVLERFEHSLEKVSDEGNEGSLRRHQSRGQLLPRDRIALILDQDSPFLELGAFAGFENKDSTTCANIVAGIGSVRYAILALIPGLRWECMLMPWQWTAVSSYVPYPDTKRRSLE